MKKFLLPLILPVLIFAASCSDQPGDPGAAGPDIITMVFQQGLYPYTGWAGTADVTLVEASPGSNYGGWDYNLFGTHPTNTYRVAIRFDLNAIVPSNVNVSCAKLTFYLHSSSGSNQIKAYALTQSFIEGTQTGGGGGTGADWETYNGASYWTDDGAEGDYNTTAISDTVDISSSSDTVTLTLDNDTVENWIANPGQNYGMIIIATDESATLNWVMYYSRDYSNVYKRPKLVVSYSLP